MNITIRQLEAFLVAAKHESLVQAAEELYLTKGAVSQALQELEKQLGAKLFDRIHPNIRLNHEGKRLRPLADDILRRCREAENLFRTEKENYLKIGVSKTIGTYILPGLFSAFREHFGWLPAARIANSGMLIDELMNFSLDALLTEDYAAHTELVAEKWIEDEMIVLAHKSHPLADEKKHSLSELQKENWVLREENSGTRKFFEENIGRIIYPYRIAQTLDSPGAVLGMTENNIGITVVSKSVLNQHKFRERFGIIELEQKLMRTLFICYHAKKYHSQSMDRFLNFCRVWQL